MDAQPANTPLHEKPSITNITTSLQINLAPAQTFSAGAMERSDLLEKLLTRFSTNANGFRQQYSEDLLCSLKAFQSQEITVSYESQLQATLPSSTLRVRLEPESHMRKCLKYMRDFFIDIVAALGL